MPILTPNELTNLRRDLRLLLPDACDIYRTTEADDAYGGQTSTAALVDSDVPVLLVATRGRAQAGLVYQNLLSGSRQYEVADYQLTFPQDVDLLIGDLITVTTLGDMQLRVVAIVVGESLEVIKQAGGQLIKED